MGWMARQRVHSTKAEKREVIGAMHDRMHGALNISPLFPTQLRRAHSQRSRGQKSSPYQESFSKALIRAWSCSLTSCCSSSSRWAFFLRLSSRSISSSASSTCRFKAFTLRLSYAGYQVPPLEMHLLLPRPETLPCSNLDKVYVVAPRKML